MEFRDNQAIYLQIADHICENILLHKWNPNDRIPSVRELAVSIEVNPNTVMRSFNYLQEKGIIYNKRGIGYFVSEDGYLKTRNLQKDVFVELELPQLFKSLELLELTVADLVEYYKAYLKQKQ